MIEACGLKGYRIGGAVISERHANFIENAGGATCADALALMAEARRRVTSSSGSSSSTRSASSARSSFRRCRERVRTAKTGPWAPTKQARRRTPALLPGPQRRGGFRFRRCAA